MPTASGLKVRNMFRPRFAQALKKRLYPNTHVGREQLSHALGVHGDTFNRWIRGEGAPSSEMMAEVIRFFWFRGDHEFAAEVLDLPVMPMVNPFPVAAPKQIAAELKAMARRIEETVAA